MSPRTIRRTCVGSSILLLACACLAAARAGAERTGGDGVVVSLDGSIHPNRLPRDRPAPVSVELSGTVGVDGGGEPPRLDRIEVAFGVHGGLDTAGLPLCPRARLRNATQNQARARCGAALVGHGTIEAEIPLNPEEPVLARASVLAFNGRSHGRPAVWVHAYSPSPPVSFVLPFYLHRIDDGAYGTLMRAPVAAALGSWPRLRSFRITLGRRYLSHGVRHSYLSARCPLPPRFHVLAVPIARATYAFSPRPTLSTTILRSCRVSG
ncbi:MAG TPA: hypothetical protein VMH33_08485 [Solirubrobacterales bacterium]|nr:hypothetical protein [Solirubrobacterales bacterium]